MKNTFAILSLAIAGSAFGVVTIDVVPSPAPNAYGSPSWNGYLGNAMTALHTGTSSIGDRNTDPTAYVSYANGASIDPSEVMVTSFNSWRGVANPAAPFASELGNRLHFGLHAQGDGSLGSQFSLSQVMFNMTSTNNDMDYVGDLAGTTFDGLNRIGYDWGTDRIRGTSDDIIYNSGEGDNVLVDELVYRGIGNAFWPGGDDADPSNPAAGRQGSIDETAAYFAQNFPYNFSTVYTIGGSSGTGAVIVTPAPGAMALLGLGGLVGLRRRR